MSQKQFEKNFKAYNKAHENQLNAAKYKMDRLMDGLAVVEDDKAPILLIDSPRSMLKELCKTQQVMVREYKFPL